MSFLFLFAVENNKNVVFYRIFFINCLFVSFFMCTFATATEKKGNEIRGNKLQGIPCGSANALSTEPLVNLSTELSSTEK